MTTNTTATNVVSLDARRAWRSSRRRSPELMAAMRRHPSYQGLVADSRVEDADAVVLRFAR